MDTGRSQTATTSIEQDIRQFIVSNFLFGDESRPLDVDESLMESGIVDSTGVLEVIAFLEGSFHIRVENDELMPENLDSIANLTAFLRRKLGSLE
jgi:acyl carrier protein